MTASAAEDGVEDALLDAVQEDVDLAPREKETVIRFGKSDEEAIIHTRESGLTRRLLAHPESTVVFLNVVEQDESKAAIDREGWDGQPVTGVEVRVPVGLLKVQSSSRASTQHAPIVSDTALSREGR